MERERAFGLVAPADPPGDVDQRRDGDDEDAGEPAALAAAFVYWTLGGFDVKPGRVASASRYQYTGGAFVLMIAAGLLSGVRFQRRLWIPALVVLAAAVAPNVSFLHEAYESYRRTSQIERADLAALEIIRPRVEPTFFLDEEIADTGYVPLEAQAWFETRDDDGSPAYDESELAEAPEHARVPADKVMAAGLGLGLAEASRPRGGGCRTVAVAEGNPPLRVPRGGVVLRAGAPMQLSLGRFSESHPVALGELTPGGWAELRIPGDLSSRLWLLQASGEGKLTFCRTARG